MSDREQLVAEQSVAAMVANDSFSHWLGLRVCAVRPRAVTVDMPVRADMLNGFGVCHGGVTFSLADSALAFACNTHGRVTMSVDNSITYPAPVHEGDVLTADAEEESSSSRLAFYRVRVRKQDGTTVALFRGTVYRTERPLV